MNNRYIYIGDNKIAPYRPDKYDNNLYCEDEIIEVVKEPSHSWEINQVLVNGKDFEFVYATGDGDGGEIIYKGDPCYPSDIKLAMPFRPISKPNTDVKQDQKQHLKDIMEADEKDGLYDNPEK